MILKIVLLFNIFLFLPIHFISAATWDIKPYLFEFISEKITNRTIYIEFKVLDEKCLEMRPGLKGKIEWGDKTTTDLERLNCELWRIPHIYQAPNNYDIIVTVENLTETIPNVVILDEESFLANLTTNPPSTPPPTTPPPTQPPTIPPPPTPPSISDDVLMPPSASPLTSNPNPSPWPATALDFTSDFDCPKEVFAETEFTCKAKGLSQNMVSEDFDFEWHSTCDRENFPLAGQGEAEITHIFDHAGSCYISLKVTNIQSGQSSGLVSNIINIKPKSAFRAFFDNLFAFLTSPKPKAKKIKEEIAISQVIKGNNGNIIVKLTKKPSSLKVYFCRLDFGNKTYQLIDDFSREIFYNYQESGAYVLTLSCLNEDEKELKSSFGLEIDITNN